jgi:hypothetical protein
VRDDDTRERLRRLEASATRALELLRAGLSEDAQRELAQVVTSPRAARHEAGGISELELEAAFESARPETEQMRDADQVLHQALLATGGHEPEIDLEPAPEEEPEFSAIPPSFATATMAELLERQGDSAGASRIRAGLAGGTRASAPAPSSRPSRKQVIDTLERWLDNLRGARA